MKLAYLTLAAALVATPALSSDLLYDVKPKKAPVYHDNSGFYVGAKGGLNKVDDVDANLTPTAGVVANLSDGWNAGLTLGYQLNSWGFVVPRVELEGGYLQNDLDTLQAFNAGGVVGAPFAATGDLNAFYGFANILLDIPVGFGFTPFVGGGVGFANVKADNIAVGGFTILDDSDTAFAWNVTAGLSYDLTRNVTVEFAYRFLQFNDVDLTDIGNTPVAIGDIDNNQFNVGIRVKL